MICPACGKDVPAEGKFCAFCGRELQIEDFGLLEDDLLRLMLEEPDITRRDEDIIREKRQKDKEEREKIIRGKKKKKRLTATLITLVIIFIAVGVGLMCFVKYTQDNSYPHQIETARDFLRDKDYTDAMEHTKKALELKPNDIDALLILAQIHEGMGEESAAIDVYKNVIERDPECVQAYEKLLPLLDKAGDYNQILTYSKYSVNAKIVPLFDAYIVRVPEFSVAPGKYDDAQSVDLKSDKKYRIYYTLDGTDPTEESTEFKGISIEVEKVGQTTIKAICVNSKGFKSEVMEGVFEINPSTPSEPVATPDGGEYTVAGSVTLTASPGNTIYYTWDGSEPTVNSQKYEGPIAMPEGNNILSCIAVNEFGITSNVARFNFAYYPE